QQVILAAEDGQPFAVIGLNRLSDPTILFLDSRQRVIANIGLFRAATSWFLNLMDENEESTFNAWFRPGEIPDIAVDEVGIQGFEPLLSAPIFPLPSKKQVSVEDWKRQRRSIPWLTKLTHGPNLPIILLDQSRKELWRFPPVSQPEIWPDIDAPQLG